MRLSTACRAVATAALLLGASLHPAHTAQDYNSSRSNKTASAAAPNELENLLEQSRAEAAAVTRHMIQVDQRDGYAGDYEIAVQVSVSIKRVKSR